MRPIDADAMYKRYCIDKSGLDGIYDTTDLPDMLAEMPTIDAIPVEWLEEHDGENISDSDGNIYGRRRITVSEALSTEFYTWMRNAPIPSDIAEKLGIKPKEE